MKIQKINQYSIAVNSAKPNSVISNHSMPVMSFPQEKDMLSFKGSTDSFKTLMEKYSYRNFADVSEMQEAFTKLFETVKTDNTIKKTPAFGLIDNLYKKSGFRGLLYELWKAHPGKEVKEIIELTKEDYILELAKIDDKNVFSLANSGPYGFFNFIRENYDAKREMSLIFRDPKAERSRADFLIDKAGSFMFINTHTAMRYHNSTGTPKTETRLGDPIEIIHYNEDGSKAFFKNWFFGGVKGPEDLVI